MRRMLSIVSKFSWFLITCHGLYLNRAPDAGYKALYEGALSTEFACYKLHEDYCMSGRYTAKAPESSVPLFAIESYRASIVQGVTIFITFYCQDVRTASLPRGSRRDGPWSLECPHGWSAKYEEARSRYNGNKIRKAFCEPPESENRPEVETAEVHTGTTECLDVQNESDTVIDAAAWVSEYLDKNVQSPITLRWTELKSSVVLMKTVGSELELFGASPRRAYRVCATVPPGHPNRKLHATLLVSS